MNNHIIYEIAKFVSHPVRLLLKLMNKQLNEMIHIYRIPYSTRHSDQLTIEQIGLFPHLLELNLSNNRYIDHFTMHEYFKHKNKNIVKLILIGDVRGIVYSTFESLELRYLDISNNQNIVILSSSMNNSLEYLITDNTYLLFGLNNSGYAINSYPRLRLISNVYDRHKPTINANGQNRSFDYYYFPRLHFYASVGVSVAKTTFTGYSHPVINIQLTINKDIVDRRHAFYNINTYNAYYRNSKCSYVLFRHRYPKWDCRALIYYAQFVFEEMLRQGVIENGETFAVAYNSYSYNCLRRKGKYIEFKGFKNSHGDVRVCRV
jgi:hypothetical protein